VARELRREGLTGRTVRLKVRTGDFVTWTRALTLAAPTCLTEEIYAAACDLFRSRIRLGGRGVRLLGVGVTSLLPPGAGQLDLFADETLERSARVARAADTLTEKYGADVVTRARLLKPRAQTGGSRPHSNRSVTIGSTRAGRRSRR